MIHFRTFSNIKFLLGCSDYLGGALKGTMDFLGYNDNFWDLKVLPHLPKTVWDLFHVGELVRD